MAKKARCPHCPTVLRRLYYQTGTGGPAVSAIDAALALHEKRGARRFVGCGWACFNCGYRTMIERPKE